MKWIWIIIGLILVPSVSALLVSPAIVDVEYTDEQEFNVTIINDISQDIVVQITFQSYEGKIDYTNYFEIKDYDINKVEIPAGSSKTIFLNLQMPELEQFGQVRFAVMRFYQVPLSQSDMAATVAVLIPVETYINYPASYVKVDLDEPGVVKQGDEIIFSAVLTHLGTDVINEINGNFIVSGNGVVDQVPINPLDLFLPDESQTVQASYNTLELVPGKYNLSLALEFDGNSKESDPARLIVGQQTVEILDFNPKNLNGGVVNTATFTLFSLWVEDLTIDLSLDLLSNGEIVKSFEFGGYTLSVNDEKIISNGVDLVGVNDGDYVARVKAKVNGEVITKDFDVSIVSASLSAPEKENNWMLYTSIVLCVIALVLFIIYMVKRKNDEENNFTSNTF